MAGRLYVARTLLPYTVHVTGKPTILFLSQNLIKRARRFKNPVSSPHYHVNQSNIMAVNAKHLATFILGAVAGVALTKYVHTEEGEKMMNDLKEKGNQFKSEAEAALDNAPEYFDNLKTQLADLLRNNFPDAEQAINDVLGKKPELPASETPEQ